MRRDHDRDEPDRTDRSEARCGLEISMIGWFFPSLRRTPSPYDAYPL
jgi:hypothetical protein